MLYILYDIIVLELSTMFYMTITVTISSDVTDVWQCDYDVTLTLTLDPKIKIWKRKRKRTLNEKASIQALHI